MQESKLLTNDSYLTLPDGTKVPYSTKDAMKVSKKSRPALIRAGKKFGFSKSRDEYLKIAAERRKCVAKLKNQGMSYSEIADELNVSINVVRSLYRQYKQKEEALQQELALL